MEVIKGKRAYIEFSTGGSSRKFGCAQSVTFEETMETKSVKTKGHGYKRKYMGQSVSATINLSGLIIYNDENFTSPFDLMAYCDSMTEVEFIIYFDSEDGTHVHSVYGAALVTTGSIGGDTSFGRSSFTLQCNEWTIGLPPVCTTVISFNLSRQGLTFRYAISGMSASPAPMKYEWRVDGGSVNSSTLPAWTIDLTTINPARIYGQHTLEVWPVCHNGANGPTVRKTFTVPFG
jgi:hypothetical protein